MHKKCLTCSLLLDIPCVTLGCPGHHNERVGEVVRIALPTNGRRESSVLRQSNA